MCFGTINNFVDHTGYFCSDRFLFKMQKKYIKLVPTYDKAKSALTEEGMRVVELLELGKMPLTKLPDF